MHGQQALVLVNYGHASGRELLDLARSIAGSRFSANSVIAIEPEVNLVGPP